MEDNILDKSINNVSQYDFLKDIPWLKQSWLGNSFYEYLLAVATFVAMWAEYACSNFQE